MGCVAFAFGLFCVLCAVEEQAELEVFFGVAFCGLDAVVFVVVFVLTSVHILECQTTSNPNSNPFHIHPLLGHPSHARLDTNIMIAISRSTSIIIILPAILLTPLIPLIPLIPVCPIFILLNTVILIISLKPGFFIVTNRFGTFFDLFI